jgi:ubiquinone/menaquinone biosynthesis C-methylase UbiE
MSSGTEIKKTVKEKYGKLAEAGGLAGCCNSTQVTCFSDDYTQLSGYVAEADLGLGCGIPTEVARLKPGDTVLDLGSGAGNDAFVARSIVGDSGKVIGVDMTDSMIAKARANAEKLGYSNVEFRLGDIEKLPVDSGSVDVVVSNCVLNLVPDKELAFSEIGRVLRPGGHFSISDIVVEGELPEAIRQSAEAYVGCVAGAIRRMDYLAIIERAGFVNVAVAKEKRLPIPDELLRKLLPDEEVEFVRPLANQIVSVTVYGEKQA